MQRVIAQATKQFNHGSAVALLPNDDAQQQEEKGRPAGAEEEPSICSGASSGNDGTGGGGGGGGDNNSPPCATLTANNLKLHDKWYKVTCQFGVPYLQKDVVEACQPCQAHFALQHVQ